MSIGDELALKMKEARLAGGRDALRALRLLKAELQVAETSGKDFREVDVVKSYAKKLRTSAEEYERLGLAERAGAMRADLEVVQGFLPRQMEPPELDRLLSALIEEKGYGPRDLGKVMKAVMGEHGDAVDGRVVREMAAEKLAQRE
jgi:uncharacterized protein YqeY